MATRAELVQVLRDLLKWGDTLTEETNQRLRDNTLPGPEALICFLAASAHRALRAIEHIEPDHLDDQITSLARFTVEASIYMDYIAVPTIRSGKTLTPDEKVTMFNSAFNDNVERLHEAKVFKKGDIIYDDVEREVIRSLKNERKAIEHPSGIFWHGITIGGVCDELAQFFADKEDAVKEIRSMQGIYGYLSQGSHPGPNYSATFAPFKIGEQPQIIRNCDCDIALAFAISCGIHALAGWNLNILDESQRVSVDEKAKGLANRLRIR